MRICEVFASLDCSKAKIWMERSGVVYLLLCSFFWKKKFERSEKVRRSPPLFYFSWTPHLIFIIPKFTPVSNFLIISLLFSTTSIPSEVILISKISPLNTLALHSIKYLSSKYLHVEIILAFENPVFSSSFLEDVLSSS